jgi:hypothetical protein
MVSGLIPSRVKLRRAKEHFNALNAEVKAFKAGKTHEVFLDEESEPGVKIYKFRHIKKIPVEWSGIIGDIVHNAVSALDSLATSLVIQAGFDSEEIIQNTYFPIHWREGDLSTGKTKAFFERVGPDVEKLIRFLEPYRRGRGDALWRLHRLDIIDKHRTILTAGIDLHGAVYEWPVPLGEAKLPDRTIYRPKPSFPLKDGDEIARTTFFEPHFEAKARFTFDIAFAETKVVDGDPVIARLKQLVSLADGIVELFDRKFFKSHDAASTPEIDEKPASLK